MPEKPKFERRIEIDGNHLAQSLERSGVDLKKINLKDALPGASAPDIEELESRLRMATGARAAAGAWKVSVTISRD